MALLPRPLSGAQVYLGDIEGAALQAAAHCRRPNQAAHQKGPLFHYMRNAKEGIMGHPKAARSPELKRSSTSVQNYGLNNQHMLKQP